MWERILSKTLAPGFLLGVCLFLFLGTALHAFPKYTSRENAIKLADVIDKGFYRGTNITTVFVKNRGEDEYYLQAILDDGSSRMWTLDNINDWTKNDELILSGNRALIFPMKGSTEFAVLEKNKFYRKIITAGAFIKTYETHDVLEGISLVYAIRKFRIIQQGDERHYTSDESGHRYRYVLELENGSKEYLTYPDAYRLMQNDALLESSLKGETVHRRPFRVREIADVPRQLEDELRNIWSFGVEVFFDRPVTLKSSQFAYQIVEQNLRDPETGMRRNQFFVHVVFPNTIKIRDVPGFRNLEYLRYVEVVTDVEHQQRVMLRAQVNPEAIELPPYVEVTDGHSVIVRFFTVTDQSVAQPEGYLRTETPVTAARMMISPEGPKTDFERAYLRAVELIRSAQRQGNNHLKVESYLGALEALRIASLRADNDAQIAQTLKQRDMLLKILPEMVIRNSQMTILALQQSGMEATDEVKKQLLRQLSIAQRHAVMEEQLQNIESLQNILR